MESGRDWKGALKERRKSLAPAESCTSSGVKLAGCDFSRGKSDTESRVLFVGSCYARVLQGIVGTSMSLP
jgi:hypothetical protein